MRGTRRRSISNGSPDYGDGLLGLETCRDGADRPCYGRLIREVDRQRGFQEEELHDRLVREHLRGYNRTEKRQLEKEPVYS